MVYYITFQPHFLQADDTSLYTLAYKRIHSDIIHCAKAKSKDNVAQHTI